MLKNRARFRCSDSCECVSALTLKFMKVLPSHQVRECLLSSFRNRWSSGRVSDKPKFENDVLMTLMTFKGQEFNQKGHARAVVFRQRIQRCAKCSDIYSATHYVYPNVWFWPIAVSDCTAYAPRLPARMGHASTQEKVI